MNPNPQHDQSDNPNPYHAPREYEYPSPEGDSPEVDSQAEGQPHLRPPAKQKKSHTLLWICLVVLVLAGLGGAAYYFFLKPKSAAPKATASDQPLAAPKTSTTPTTKSPSSVVKSTKLTIDITKQANWTAKVDDSTGAITLTSPETTYTTSGKSVQGTFVLKAQPGIDNTDIAFVQGTVAAADSLSIAYDAPTSNQLQYSLITTGGPKDAANFLVLYSSYTFKKGDSMNKITLGPTDPLVIFGGFTHTGATGPAKFDSLTVNDFMTSSAYTQAVASIKSLKAY